MLAAELKANRGLRNEDLLKKETAVNWKGVDRDGPMTVSNKTHRGACCTSRHDARVG
jgi:hypothetical protein